MSLAYRFLKSIKDRFGSEGEGLTTLATGFKAVGYEPPRSSPPMRFQGFGGGTGWGSGLSGWQGVFFDLLQGTYRGSKINYSTEIGDLLQSSLLLTPIKWLGRVLPEAPIYLSRKDDNEKEVEKIYRHESVTILNRPNPYYGGKLLMSGFAASWDLDANVYFRKVRGLRSGVRGRKVMAELYYVPHFRIRPIWPTDGSMFISHYEETINGQIQKIPVEDIIHFRDGIDPRNERSGLSSTQAILREVYGDNEAANIMAALFRNGGLGGLLLSPKTADFEISPDDAEILKDGLLRKTTGDDRFKPFSALGPVDVTKTSFNPKELDLRSGRRFSEERAGAIYPGNGYVFGFGAHMERAIYNNVSEGRRDAFDSSLKPLLTYIEDELDAQYLPDFFEDNELPSLSFEHDYSHVAALQEDRNDAARRASLLFAQGVIDRYRAKVLAGEAPEEEDKGVYTARMSSGMSAALPASELPKGRRQVKAKPSEGDIDEAVSWWQATQDPAGGALIDARTN